MMTSNEMLDTYETLSELTSNMLDAARLGEWDQLTELEQRCKVHVNQLMASTQVRLNEKEQRSKIAIIRSILQNDAKIRALTEPHMHAMQQQLHMMRTSQRSLQAYGAQRA